MVIFIISVTAIISGSLGLLLGCILRTGHIADLQNEVEFWKLQYIQQKRKEIATDQKDK